MAEAQPFYQVRLLFPIPALGGGALLDVGVYAVSFTSFVLGEPVRIESMMTPAPTGLDAQAACILGYDGGELALVSTAVTTNTPWEATILETNGKIRAAQTDNLSEL